MPEHGCSPLHSPLLVSFCRSVLEYTNVWIQLGDRMHVVGFQSPNTHEEEEEGEEEEATTLHIVSNNSPLTSFGMVAFTPLADRAQGQLFKRT